MRKTPYGTLTIEQENTANHLNTDEEITRTRAENRVAAAKELRALAEKLEDGHDYSVVFLSKLNNTDSSVRIIQLFTSINHPKEFVQAFRATVEETAKEAQQERIALFLQALKKAISSQS